MKSESFIAMPETEALSNPFPGLRPFEFDESHLFFGRDGQSEQLLRKLAATRFVAVVGTSGSGKSSLVRAGLLPDLFGGFIASAGSRWRVAMMRPSNDPLGNLSQALASPGVFGSDREENAQLQATIIEATLRRGSRGLAEVVRQNRMPASENVLIVVDQFEELFRFARVSGDQQYQYEAASFVKLLLEATRQRESAIYVVLTMRSDFLGDCSLFWGLPEAVNEGQYLIPRLTRDQRSEAITGPVAVGGAEITGRLVNRLLNDMGDDADQLPILQHALMRAWDDWKKAGDERAPIDLRHYEAIGGMSEALSRHADEAYNELPDERSRLVAERIFKGLTEKGADNREIRRPVLLAELCAISEATQSEVVSVIELFRRTGRTFLMPPAPVPLAEDSLIDISHESLIRNWARLKEWVDEEALSAQIYRRLAETAALYERGEAGLWRDPDLQIALNWREQNRPNQVWANRYHKGFDAAMRFLDASVARRDAEALEAEKKRLKELRRARLTAIIFALAFLFSLAVLTYALIQRGIAEEARTVAEEQRKIAVSALASVERARNEAVEQKNIATSEAHRAEEESHKATKEKENAERQKKIAEEKTIETQHALARAEAQTKLAEENRALAERNRRTAEEQRSIAVKEGEKAASELEKNRQLLYAADVNLAQQAYEANNIERGRALLSRHGAESPEAVQSSLAGFEYYYLWRLYHVESKTLFGHTGAVNAVAFAPDGKIIASGSSDGDIRLWDKRSKGSESLVRPILKGEVKAVAYSPDGKMLALASGNGEVELLPATLKDAGVMLKLPERLRNGSVASLSNLTFSPDGRALAIGISTGVKGSKGMTHTVLVWDTETGQLRADLGEHTSFINAIAYSPDGGWFATASADGLGRLWETTTAGYKYQGRIGLVLDNSPAQGIAFSGDGKRLAVGHQNGRVRLWEGFLFAYNRELITPQQRKSAVSSLAFTLDDKLLAAGGEDGTIQLLSKTQPGDSYQELTTLKGHTEAVTSLSFSPDGSVLASGSRDKFVKLWDTGPQIFKLLPRSFDSAVSGLALSADGKTLAVGSIDATVKLCAPDTLQPCKTWRNPAGGIKSMALSPDGQRLAIGEQNNTVELLNLNPEHQAQITLAGHADIVNTIAFSPDGRWLATGSRDATVRLWDMATNAQVKMRQLNGQNSARVVVFSPDGRTLAVGDNSGDVMLWSIDADQIVPLKGIARSQGSPVTSIAFSSGDGKLIAAGSQDGTVRLWNIDAPEALHDRLDEGQVGGVNALAFSPDSKTLATGGADGTIKLWSVRSSKKERASSKELITLSGHKKAVTSLVFDPHGKWLASGSYDNTVRFWYAATGDEYKAQLNK